MKITILDGYTTNPGDLSFEGFEQFGQVDYYDRTPAELTVQRAKGAQVVITNKTLLGADVLKQLPDCKYIGLLSTGYDVVDLDYTNENGITVCNIPSYSTEAVAQSTFAHILNIANQVKLHSDCVKAGEWAACNDFCFMKSPLFELQGKTLGLFGFGRIAKSVANIAKSFGMKVIGYSRSGFEHEFVQSVSLDELFCMSDILSLHAPLNPGTNGIICKDNIDKMKDGAVIINTSRGKLINEQHLADALMSGKIAAAGVDVLSTEPPKADNPLVGCKNCYITPHIAWAATETRGRLVDIAVKNLEAFLNGNPINTVK
ncbi:MAG: D-2-hydroxyacid dehydrogenase [Clostridia bacterium]|nr:D-2-hydroxyacid dehydrogenase [Clostridia bacterium]